MNLITHPFSLMSFFFCHLFLVALKKEKLQAGREFLWRNIAVFSQQLTISAVSQVDVRLLINVRYGSW